MTRSVQNLFAIIFLCELLCGSVVSGETSRKVYKTSVFNQSVAEKNKQITITESTAHEIYHEDWIDHNKNGKRDAYEDSSQAIETRIADLISRMNIKEKTCQLATLYGYQRVLKDDLPTKQWDHEIWKDGLANIDEHLNGIPEWRGKPKSDYLGPPSVHARAMNEVQRWFIENTRLGIPVDFTNEGIRGLCYTGATNFPAQVGVGATWNPDLVYKIGQVTGREASVVGYTNIYSPILDLSRDPRWGRVVECYGEDPFHVGTLGTAQAKALRDEGVASTAKHFAIYSIPKGGRDGEARTDPHVGSREMRDMYLLPFEMTIQGAGLQGVMSSYNDYNGVPVSGSHKLMVDELRDRMGFRGYVVSDSQAVKYLHGKHKVVGDYQSAAARFIESGGNVRTNFSPPQKFIKPLRKAIIQGELSEDIVNERVADVLRVKFELGLFDEPFVMDPAQADSIIACNEHTQIALQAARESIVLLKNEERTLPLKKNLDSILVCGPNAKAIGHSISRYGPVGGEVISIYDGIRNMVSPETRVEYALGAKVIDSGWPQSELYEEGPSEEDLTMIDEAVKLAMNVEVVVLVIGESEATIGESKSRTSLRLTGYQRHLAQALHKTGKPVIAVLVNGRALAINWIDDHLPAIVEAWFPGQACGRAVAEVLFGDYNPGGKLPVTFPKTVGQLPLNFPYKRGSHGGQGTGHNPNGVGKSRVVGTLYPFGYGLSYTTFEYDKLNLSSPTLDKEDAIEISFQLKNSGQRLGDEVVQLYVEDVVSSVVTYEKILRGFKRITLAPGEVKTVKFELPASSLAITGSDDHYGVEPGTFKVMVGSSSEDIRLNGEFEVISVSEVLSKQASPER